MQPDSVLEPAAAGDGLMQGEGGGGGSFIDTTSGDRDGPDLLPLTPQNQAPTVGDKAFLVNENSANGTVVCTVVASEPDAGDTLTIAITAGNTSGAFAINPNTDAIVVANAGAPDFETNPVVNLTVEVTDQDVLTDTVTVTINLYDVNEPLEVDGRAFTAEAKAANGTTGARRLPARPPTQTRETSDRADAAPGGRSAQPEPGQPPA